MFYRSCAQGKNIFLNGPTFFVLSLEIGNGAVSQPCWEHEELCRKKHVLKTHIMRLPAMTHLTRSPQPDAGPVAGSAASRVDTSAEGASAVCGSYFVV